MDGDRILDFIAYSNLLTKAGLWALLTAGILVLPPSTRERAVRALGPAFLLCLLGALTDFAHALGQLCCGNVSHLIREVSVILLAGLVLATAMAVPFSCLAAGLLPLPSIRELIRSYSTLPVALLDLALIGLTALALSRILPA